MSILMFNLKVVIFGIFLLKFVAPKSFGPSRNIIGNGSIQTLTRAITQVPEKALWQQRIAFNILNKGVSCSYK